MDVAVFHLKLLQQLAAELAPSTKVTTWFAIRLWKTTLPPGSETGMGDSRRLHPLAALR